MPDAADVNGFFKRKPSNAADHQLRFAKMQKIKMNLQDPLMRRIDGSHMIPPSAVIPNHITRLPPILFLFFFVFLSCFMTNIKAANVKKT